MAKYNLSALKENEKLWLDLNSGKQYDLSKASEEELDEIRSKFPALGDSVIKGIEESKPEIKAKTSEK